MTDSEIFSKKSKMEQEIAALLEYRELTEYQRGCWCQSGAQAGWGPDLDVPDTAAVVVSFMVNERGELRASLRINNDIYSERVRLIESDAKALGFSVSLRNDYNPVSTLPVCPECGASMNREATSCYNATCRKHQITP